MKKSGILNAPVAAVVARLGHLDTLCIADAGLPIPAGPERIDLVVRRDLPGFHDVTAMVLGEMAVQEAIVAGEMAEKSPQILTALRAQLGDVPIRTVPHDAFKAQTQRCAAVIRTGECTPYANVILVAGVIF
jgi:D-ribose pyranase